MFNKAQKFLIRVTIAVFTLQALFPPWRLVITEGDKAPDGWSEGFAFLFTPPTPSPNAFQYQAKLEIHLEWQLLLALWAVTVISGVAACIVFRKDTPEEDSGFLAMLKYRKLPLSIIIGLGLPIPIVGYPTVFGVTFILQDSHAGVAFAMLSLVTFLGLSILSFLVFLTLGYIKSDDAASTEITPGSEN